LLLLFVSNIMEDTSPSTPPPVLIFAEQFGDPTSNKRPIDDALFDLSPSDEDMPPNKHQKNPGLLCLEHLLGTFSFSGYRHWLEDILIPERSPNAEIRQLFGTPQEGIIHFNNFVCEVCASDIVITLGWYIPRVEEYCNCCSFLVEHTIPMGLMNNHDFSTRRDDLVLLIKDLNRPRADQANTVSIEETNRRRPAGTLNLALSLDNYGLAAIFSEMYRTRVSYDKNSDTFLILENQNWVKKPILWFKTLVGTQLSDQFRWLREDLNTRLLHFKKNTKRQLRDPITFAALEKRIEVVGKMEKRLESSSKAGKIIALLKQDRNILDSTIPINWH
jgi:hypothetical protein